jgi:hypothetical protein
MVERNALKASSFCSCCRNQRKCAQCQAHAAARIDQFGGLANTGSASAALLNGPDNQRDGCWRAFAPAPRWL